MLVALSLWIGLQTTPLHLPRVSKTCCVDSQDSIWLATEPMDMRADPETALEDMADRHRVEGQSKPAP